MFPFLDGRMGLGRGVVGRGFSVFYKHLFGSVISWATDLFALCVAKPQMPSLNECLLRHPCQGTLAHKCFDWEMVLPFYGQYKL